MPPSLTQATDPTNTLSPASAKAIQRWKPSSDVLWYILLVVFISILLLAQPSHGQGPAWKPASPAPAGLPLPIK